MLKFVDLFAGIGGIREGLKLAFQRRSIASECVFSSEIDKKAQETYELNFGETPAGDIRLVEELPDHDIMLAGFPCQAFSYAGKQKGFADTRGTLFFEIERLLGNAENKPRLLLLENVRGLTTHDGGRTYAAILLKLERLGYGVCSLLLNSSNFGVPQNRVRLYLVCSLGRVPRLSIKSDLGAPDSHKFKRSLLQDGLFHSNIKYPRVSNILEEHVDKKYLCTPLFVERLTRALKGKPLESLHGVRLIDYRGGNSLHSWNLGMKGICAENEIALMDALIVNRRKKYFGSHQDGKMLTMEQIRTFWPHQDVEETLASLVQKRYLKSAGGKYNPVCGNMSFEVFKFLDPSSIAITVVSSDAHRLGVVQNGVPRRITPRECARLQGFPDEFALHPDDASVYRQLGNSVSVPTVAAIFEDLIMNNELPFDRHLPRKSSCNLLCEAS
ncbi:DNA (cytosine-5)-methyltransferase 1 [Nitrosospira sp. Nl5]|uniref:DNA (cytosine-5-)-methyltransferase n=1 Tax=Nitrosospira sp. Nl5 TaxID=200120 RepID=UPI00087F9C02|nr:DNA (cytosine-5-)-methyltransferase [Nitrosospira sp. Nl5]SCY62426.1 DNA (cytosine-5)-methyltransferase 1 [Nitrosospira sp. Nl5]